MIQVEYYPAYEGSPLPDGNKCYNFETFESFKDWVQSYVCRACLLDFKDCAGRNPETIKDWLEMGCGCEIGVTDDTNMIDWNSKMVLPENFEELLDEH